MIDDEVRKLIEDAYIKTKKLLVEKKEEVEKIATALLEREVLFQSDVEALIGKRPFEEKKSLVDDVVAEVTDENAIVVEPTKEEDKSTDEQTGNIGLAPGVESLNAFAISAKRRQSVYLSSTGTGCRSGICGTVYQTARKVYLLYQSAGAGISIEQPD